MSAPLPIRSPWRVDPRVLERLMVDRGLVDRLEEDLLSMHGGQGAAQVVLVGPIGAGRSHRLAVIADRLRRRGVPVAVIDEDVHLASPSHLFAALAAQLGRPTTPDDRALAALDEAAPGGAVFVVDRVDLLMDAIGDVGQSTLRAALQDRARWSLIGGARAVREPFTDRAAPFYRSFAAIPLPELTADEGRALLARLAHESRDAGLRHALERRPERADEVHRAIGGRPGAWSTLLPFIAGERWADPMDGWLNAYAEAMSPSVRRFVHALPPTQRAVYASLLAAGAALPVGEIARRLGQDPKITSTMLRRLEAEGIVAAASRGRERWYAPTDPLHRLAGRPPAAGV